MLQLNKLRIATRRSKLAMAQTEYIARELGRIHPDLVCEIVPFVTRGDKIQSVALSKVGGKGLFVSELEAALLAGEADIAVHSLKDVPGELADGLVIGAVPLREDPRDALIIRLGLDFDSLPAGSVIGTSSLRRQAQLRVLRPDFIFDTLRGNIDTRLAKVNEGHLSAIVLAAAGLRRLSLHERITRLLEPNECLPAVGQGALGIECRNDETVLELLSPLTDEPTRNETDAERSLLKQLNGGCQVPIGGYAQTLPSGDIWLRGYVSDGDGRDAWHAQASGRDPVAVGQEVAQKLLDSGAHRALSGWAHQE